MKLFIICSKAFYAMIPPIQSYLESKNVEVILPNCYDHPEEETKMRNTPMHGEWKAKMYQRSEEIISQVDGVLVINEEKNGVANYIGGATFLEMYDAFRFHKKIYLLNGIPEGILKDEIIGFSPCFLNGDIHQLV